MKFDLHFCVWCCSLAIQHVSWSQDSDSIYALGFVGSSEFAAYHISYKNGEVLLQIRNSFKGGFCGEASLVFEDMVVALDASRSALISISFKNGIIEFHQMHFADHAPEFLGEARLLPSKFHGMLAISISSSVILLRVKGINHLEVAEKIDHPSTIISDALSISKEQEAFAMLQHDGSRISLKVKFNNDLTNEILKETLQLDSHRGNVEKAFINIYTRTDRTYGFRVLLIMEDHSLLLVQQGEIVWSREDGLASIIDSTTSELPVEKEGVSVARVEHNLFEWLKVHF